MYGVYPFAAAYFGEAPPGEASIPTFHDEVAVECKRLDCPTTNDFSAYNLQDGSSREVPNVEVECKTLDCESSQDIPIYSLQDAIFFNGTPITVILTCPEGYVCPPNMPPTITYPPGTFTFPDPGPCNGFPIVLTMIGCISPVTRTLPCSATPVQVNNAAQQIILEIARQQALCSVIDGNPPPNPIGFLNQRVSRTVQCPDGSSAVFTGVLPSWLEFNTVTGVFTAKAGVFSGTSQNNANTNAINSILNFINNSFTAGTLECVIDCVIDNSSPLPTGQEGVAYSQTLAASVITGTLTWTVTGGSLPAGLSLNSATGEISGTPTTATSASFTVEVSNGIISCNKPFELLVTVVGGFDWSLIDWVTQDGGGGPGTVSALGDTVNFSGVNFMNLVGVIASFNSPGANVKLTLNGNATVAQAGAFLLSVSDSFGDLLLIQAGDWTFSGQVFNFTIPPSTGNSLLIWGISSSLVWNYNFTTDLTGNMVFGNQ